MEISQEFLSENIYNFAKENRKKDKKEILKNFENFCADICGYNFQKSEEMEEDYILNLDGENYVMLSLDSNLFTISYKINGFEEMVLLS